jgi:hypothetical protein
MILESEPKKERRPSNPEREYTDEEREAVIRIFEKTTSFDDLEKQLLDT